LIDDPLFLTNQGVYAMATRDISSERYAQERSYFISNRLSRELNKHDAVATSFDGKYILSINGSCYVADSRQDVQRPPNTLASADFQYEWYYWNNVHARVFFVYDDHLYFGTPDGELMMFWNVNDSAARGKKYSDNGEPVKCYWRFPLFYGGQFAHFKTIRGVWAVPIPYLRSGIEIYYATKSIDRLVKETSLDIFDWNNVEFDRFTFSTDRWEQIIPTNRKLRKFTICQIMVQNSVAEPFGFTALEMQYTINNSRVK
jgi:hypothetical protein